MGNRKSLPSAEITGDKDVTIINTQELHSQFHDEHLVKITIILVIVSVQMLMVAYKIWHKRVRRNAIKKVQSIADREEV